MTVVSVLLYHTPSTNTRDKGMAHFSSATEWDCTGFHHTAQTSKKFRTYELFLGFSISYFGLKPQRAKSWIRGTTVFSVLMCQAPC